jgi:multiple sugar transport system ATP-binding protein
MSNVGLKNVAKIYPGKKGADIAAVRDLSIDIQEREFVVLTGPSGSGKSSVMRMIAGLEEVSKGEILLGDRRMNDVLPKDRDIGLVAGNHAPYTRMSVWENLAFPLTLRKFSKAEIKKRVAAAAAIVELQDSLERRPESLSAEERQGVALGRALVRQPKVFLFDEPFANLDATARRKMRAQVKKLRQRLPATIIYATSDPIEAMAMGERIVVMNNGVIEQDGSASRIYNQPANMFVAGFLGSPPMNFIRGTVKLDRDSILFSEAEDGTIKLRLAVSDFPGAREFVGQPVVLGLRPENIQIAQTSKASNTFAAIVNLVEPLGATADLQLQTGAHSVVSRNREGIDGVEAGHRSEFEVDLRKVHLFDPTSGHRIT